MQWADKARIRPKATIQKLNDFGQLAKLWFFSFEMRAVVGKG